MHVTPLTENAKRLNVFEREYVHLVLYTEFALHLHLALPTTANAQVVYGSIRDANALWVSLLSALTLPIYVLKAL